jgi:hypothetical protein
MLLTAPAKFQSVSYALALRSGILIINVSSPSPLFILTIRMLLIYLLFLFFSYGLSMHVLRACFLISGLMRELKLGATQQKVEA